MTSTGPKSSIAEHRFNFKRQISKSIENEPDSLRRITLKQLLQLYSYEVRCATSDLHRDAHGWFWYWVYFRIKELPNVCVKTPYIVIYVAIECAIRWSQNRVDEVHGPYRGMVRSPFCIRRPSPRQEILHLKPPSRDPLIQNLTRFSRFGFRGKADRSKSQVIDQLSSPLFRLPFEIREMIWLSAIKSSKPVRVTTYNIDNQSKTTSTRLMLRRMVSGELLAAKVNVVLQFQRYKDQEDQQLLPSILLTCHKLYAELIDDIYRFSRFQFESLAAFIRFTQTVPTKHLKAIKQLDLRWSFQDLNLSNSVHDLRHLAAAFQRLRKLRGLNVITQVHKFEALDECTVGYCSKDDFRFKVKVRGGKKKRSLGVRVHGYHSVDPPIRDVASKMEHAFRLFDS